MAKAGHSITPWSHFRKSEEDNERELAQNSGFGTYECARAVRSRRGRNIWYSDTSYA
jgi:hypothetical protein